MFCVCVVPGSVWVDLKKERKRKKGKGEKIHDETKTRHDDDSGGTIQKIERPVKSFLGR